MPGEILYNVPVFPLNTVLFPGMPIHLHVFEERYRVMVQDIQHGDKRFCVALISEGQEVGGQATPFDVVCLAEVVHLQLMADGRYFLVAVGVERVKLLSTDRVSKPYLTGNIEIWADESDHVNDALVGNASRLFLQYIHYIMKLSGQEEEKLSMPSEPELLSYMLAMGLQIETPARQRLLEIPGSEERLQSEVELLQTELPMLRALASNPLPPGVGFGQFLAN